MIARDSSRAAASCSRLWRNSLAATLSLVTSLPWLKIPQIEPSASRNGWSTKLT